MKLNDLLNWRYAAKSMNGNSIPSEKLENILENIRLSASSAGLQPYKILVVESKELREKIKAIAYNQQQITDASQLLIFAAWSEVTPARIDSFITNIATTRNVSEESLEGMRAMVSPFMSKTSEEVFHWSSKQAYIAMGTALIAAAAEGVDATPMEGFDNAALDQLLDLPSLGLRSASIMPLGYRNEETDWLVKLPKVRTPKEELFIKL